MPAGNFWNCAPVTGRARPTCNKPRLGLDDSFLGIVFRRKKPMQLENVQHSALYQNVDMARREGLVSLLSAPLVFGGQAIGTLNIYTGAPRSFSNEEIHILRALAELSAIAMEKARLYERIVDVEEQLRQNEKFSALGLLAAEVAHEIRNPLTVMKMLYHSLRLDFRARRSAGQGRRHPAGENGATEQNRGADPGFRPRHRAEPGRGQRQPIAGRSGPADAPQNAQPAHSIRRRLAPGLPPILADATQLAQAFLNLVLNAIEAMPGGGTLTISTRSFRHAPRQPRTDAHPDRIQGHRPGHARRTTPPRLHLPA